MSLAQIEEMLRTAMGLDAASVGNASFERVLVARQRKCGLESQEAYYHYLRATPSEFQELIEAMVVPETWFFRHREAFGALVRIAGEWLPRHPFGLLKVLCVPCSSGEEPYSIVMALQGEGFPEGRFSVDAVDISQVALDRAERAVYGKNSFRGGDTGFRDQYFLHTERGYHVIGPVRDRVRFRRGNILDLEVLSVAASYDIIFCRNLLIYFDRATQEKILAALRAALAPGGTAFMGPAEALVMRSSGFAPTGDPGAFAFQATRPEAGPPAPKRPPRLQPPPALRALPAVASPAPRAVAKPAPAPASPPSRTSGLERARELADSGQLEAAIAACLAHLAQVGESAEAHYLMGLAHGAQGNEERAHAEYRKALYLEPDHYEALIHLALLTEKRGDASGARRLQERARRLAV